MKYCIYCMLGLLLCVSCSREETVGQAQDGMAEARLKVDGLSGSSGEEADSEVGIVKGFRFEDGRLEEIFSSLSVDEERICRFRPSRMKGEVYFLANPETVEGLDGLVPGVTRLEDYMGLKFSSASLSAGALPMTGRMLLDGSDSPVSLKRSVARVDLSSFSKGVAVKRVSVSNILRKGYVNKTGNACVPDRADTADFRKTYADGEFVNRREPLFYLAEQENPELEVEIVIESEGAWHRLKTRLPETVRRNTVYHLQVHGLGASAAVDVAVGDWEYGDGTESESNPLGRVDVAASDLSDGVRVSATNDTVYVPYYGSDFRLALSGESDARVEVDGMVQGVTVQPLSVRSLQPVAEVAVASLIRMPGTIREYIYLDIFSQDAYSGRVVLVFEESPVRLEGKIRFDSEGVCDFGQYVEGELGQIVLPENRVIRLEFAENSSHWMRLDEREGKIYRILGGWKPNDPEADGRVQEGRIVISDPDGRHEESYTIRRINWGLPVVNIHGTWWCKYNLRGNVKRFEDQVSIADDPASQEDLAAYLTDCSEEELLRLMGHQYQAGNPDGLPLAHDGSSFYFEGMKASGQNFGTADPVLMAPEGYRIPSYEDYAFFSWGDDVNMGGVGSRQFNNKTGQRLTVSIVERDVSFLEKPFGVISFYDFELDGSHWVLFGLGHQWNTTSGNIARMNILLATYGDSSRSWGMEGYSSAEKPGNNWFKFVAHNNQKTRTIRCVKIPVEYVYE